MAVGQTPDGASFEQGVRDLGLRLDRYHGQRSAGTEELLQDLESAHEELRVADEELRTQQEELDRLIESQRTERWMHERLIAVLPAAVVVTDEHGLVHMANAAAAGLLGRRVDLLLGRPLFIRVHEDDRTVLRRALARSIAQSCAEFRESVRFRSDDGPLSLEVAATVRRDPVNDRTEIVWVLVAGDEAGNEPAESHGSRLARALVRLTELPLSTLPTTEVLPEVARICEDSFAFPVSVSISLGDPEDPDSVATDTKLAQYVDGAQVMAGEGPCEDAYQSGSRVEVADLHADDRWPVLQAKLDHYPVHGVVAMPIRVGESVVGTLNVYGEDTSVVSDATAVETCELLAAAVGAVLHEAEVKAELEHAAPELRKALESRATIDQAKGMIMASQGCGPDEAFRCLSRASSNANVKLRDIAARMVEEASQGVKVLPDQREVSRPGRG